MSVRSLVASLGSLRYREQCSFVSLLCSPLALASRNTSFLEKVIVFLCMLWLLWGALLGSFFKVRDNLAVTPSSPYSFFRETLLLLQSHYLLWVCVNYSSLWFNFGKSFAFLSIFLDFPLFYFNYYFYIWVFCMHTHVHHVIAQCLQKPEEDNRPLELDLHMAVSCHVSAGNTN